MYFIALMLNWHQGKLSHILVSYLISMLTYKVQHSVELDNVYPSVTLLVQTAECYLQ